MWSYVRVGILAKLDAMTRRPAKPGSALAPSGAVETGITSPWAQVELTRIVWADLLGDENLPVTRAQAMGVPPIARGRHILTATIADAPLVTRRGDAPGTPAPWLQSTGTVTSPQHRMAWTVDDLIFHGWSLWVVQRDQGGITDAMRCPWEWWSFNDRGAVEIDGAEVPADSVLLIPGFHEGILNSSPRTIRGARELENQWSERAANPIPAAELHQTTPDKLTPTEVQDLLDGWSKALRSNGSTVGYTPQSLELRTHGEASADLLVEGRNAAAIDAARVLGLPASLIDASNVNSTLTYETAQGRNGELRDYSLKLYTVPIAARLSLDDVCPPGERVAFDLSEFTVTTPDPSGPATED